MKKVAKFGGTSMADARAITRSADIVKADKERRYVVVSAPGKRFSQDIKVRVHCEELSISGDKGVKSVSVAASCFKKLVKRSV